MDLDSEGSEANHPYANDFEYRYAYTSAKEVNCPFAAHTRKMRPRADLYVGEDGDETVTVETNTVNNSNVILRRSITFGPELTKEDETTDKEQRSTKRGIYFCCYQGDLRNGFNFLVTREWICPCTHLTVANEFCSGWASNNVFASKANFKTPPGVDPIVSQRNRPDHPAGTFAIFEKNDNPEPTTLDLGYLPWIDQKGGEYFFTPSITALRTVFVDEVP